MFKTDTSMIWLFIAIILGLEYFLKQLFEDINYFSPTNPLRRYFLYRIINLIIIVFLPVFLLEVSTTWYCWVLISILLVFLSSFELLISFLYNYIAEKTKIRFVLLLFIVPSLLLLASLTIPMNIRVELNGWLLKLYNQCLSILSLNPKINKDKFIFIISVFIILSNTVNYIIRWLVIYKNDIRLSDDVVKFIQNKKLYNKSTLEIAASKDDNIYEQFVNIKAGRIIGVLERWLVLIFILINQFAAIGFLLAAKAVARFKESNSSFKMAETSFIGTLYSVLITILFGFLLLNIK